MGNFMNTTRFQWGSIVVVVGLLLFLRAHVTAEQLPMGDCNTPKPRTDLRHCVFWNKAFSGIDLHGALLDGVSLRGTNLTGCNLSGADLQNADLTGSALEKADFTRANLSGASLKGVTLDETIFSEANLDQADFKDAVIENRDETWFRHAINLPIHLQKMLNQ